MGNHRSVSSKQLNVESSFNHMTNIVRSGGGRRHASTEVNNFKIIYKIMFLQLDRPIFLPEPTSRWSGEGQKINLLMYRNQLLHTWTICGVCNHYHQQRSQRTTCANIEKMPRNQTLHAENSTIAIKALLYAGRIWEKNTKPKHHLARRVTVPVTALDQMILLNVLQLWRPLLFLWLIAMYQTVKRNHLSWTVAIDAHAKSAELEVIAHPARLNTVAHLMLHKRLKRPGFLPLK